MLHVILRAERFPFSTIITTRRFDTYDITYDNQRKICIDLETIILVTTLLKRLKNIALKISVGLWWILAYLSCNLDH